MKTKTSHFPIKAAYYGVLISNNVRLVADDHRRIAAFADASVRQHIPNYNNYKNHEEFIKNIEADINKVYGDKNMYTVMTYDCEAQEIFNSFINTTHFRVVVDVDNYGFNSFMIQ